jgi:hypothetical protein
MVFVVFARLDNLSDDSSRIGEIRLLGSRNISVLYGITISVCFPSAPNQHAITQECVLFMSLCKMTMCCGNIVGSASFWVLFAQLDVVAL